MTRALSLVTLLSACAGAPVATVDPIDALGDLPDGERTCLRQACADAATAEQLQTCRAERCAERADAWKLQPTSIRHEGATVFVQARVEHAPGGFGDVVSEREVEAYVGCTVVTSTGAEIDLAVTTIFPDTLDAPVMLASEVGPDVRDVIFGVWDRKIEPCDSDRMGCQEYGFLLDGSLATWPPTVYVDGTRQRIPPPKVAVEIRDGGAGPDFPALRDKVLAALRDELALFGATVDSVQTRIADAHAPKVIVAHGDDHDRLLARKVAAALDASGKAADLTRFQDGLPAPFVVTLPGTAARFEATQGACGSAVGEAFDSCVADMVGRPE
jgi:hypothetical protein